MRLNGWILACLALVPVGAAQAQSPEELLAAASALIDAGKPADAAQKLEAFLAANPKHPKAGVAALALGRCDNELKLWPKAVVAFEKAIASKDPAVVNTAQLGLGEAAINTRQWEKAANALAAATKQTLEPEQASIAFYWLGLANTELGRHGPAEAAYAKVAADFPNAEFAADALFGAALAASKQGKSDVARQRFRALAGRYPRSGLLPHALLAQAQLDIDDKRYSQARDTLEGLLRNPAVKSAPEVAASAEESLVRILLELKDYAAAAARIDSVLARLPANDPQRARAQLSLGHCRYHEKNYEPAWIAYREASKSSDPAVASEGLYWAANAAIALNRPGEAAPLFHQFASRFPKDPQAARAMYRAGEAYLAVKQNDQALAAFRAVTATYPQAPEAEPARKETAALLDAVDDPAALAAALKTALPAEKARGLLRLGRIHLQAKRYPQAVTSLTDLLKIVPEPKEAAEGSYLLGLAQEASGQAASAAAALAGAVRRAGTGNPPWAADAQSRLAWLYIDLKQPAKAEAAAAAALALKPDAELERQARLAQMQAQLDLKQYDAALENCRVLLAGNPPAETLVTLLFTQAWVAEKQGKPGDALPVWERLATEFPKSEYAAEALLHVGDARLKAEKYDEARARYAALLENFPANPAAVEARFKLGSSLYGLGKYDESAVEFGRVVADPKAGELLPEALYWSGVALEKAGKKAEAIPPLARLVKQFPKHPRVATAKIHLAALKAVAGG